jgi:hypothetical protein
MAKQTGIAELTVDGKRDWFHVDVDQEPFKEDHDLRGYRIMGRAVVTVSADQIPGGGTYQALVAQVYDPDGGLVTAAIFWDRPSNRFIKVKLE